jgi:hypothetical protein
VDGDDERAADAKRCGEVRDVEEIRPLGRCDLGDAEQFPSSAAKAAVATESGEQSAVTRSGCIGIVPPWRDESQVEGRIDGGQGIDQTAQVCPRA